jgi:hypothetical protein
VEQIEQIWKQQGASAWKQFILWIQLLEVIYSVDPAFESYLFCGFSFWKLFILWTQLLEVIYYVELAIMKRRRGTSGEVIFLSSKYEISADLT